MQSKIVAIQQPIAELPHLGFRRYQPHLHLRSWVQCYWVAQQQHLPETGFIETLYPDGGTSLVFSFANETLPNIHFKASQTVSKIHFQKSIDCIGIRFNPGGAFALYGINMLDIHASEESNTLIPDGESLPQHLASLDTTHARLAAIENWLLIQLQRRQPSPGVLQDFIPRFLQSDLSLELAIKQESIGRRQLERKFQQEIGLSPSYFKLLNRMKKARGLITLNPLVSLTDIAQDSGFYDQAHFTRQFQKIVGQTPGQYKARKMSQIYNS